MLKSGQEGTEEKKDVSPSLQPDNVHRDISREKIQEATGNAESKAAADASNEVLCTEYSKFGTCSWNKCKFVHKDSRPVPAPESKPSATQESTSKQVTVTDKTCRDFLNGICSRTKCKFEHPKDPEASQSNPNCLDFLNGICIRTNCMYVHPKPTGEAPPTSVPVLNICKDFLNGKCTRVQCKFEHTEGLTKAQTVCFHNGKCTIIDCKFLHTDLQYDPTPAAPCKDFIKGKCGRVHCKFSHNQPKDTPNISSLFDVKVSIPYTAQGPPNKVARFTQQDSDEGWICLNPGCKARNAALIKICSACLTDRPLSAEIKSMANPKFNHPPPNLPSRPISAPEDNLDDFQYESKKKRLQASYVEEINQYKNARSGENQVV